jgi:hypothetical protein
LQGALNALNNQISGALYGSGDQGLDNKKTRQLLSLIKILKKQT